MPDAMDKPRWWPWLLMSGLVVLFDQVTKWLVQQSLGFGHSAEVLPFFNLVLVYNPGAAFSFLSSAPGWQRPLFVAVGLAASALIVYLLRRHARDPLFCFALALIMGGALGNVIDRLMLGAVVDFLDFHAFGRHFPAFNLADSAICTGVALVFIVTWKTERAAAKTSGGSPAQT